MEYISWNCSSIGDTLSGLHRFSPGWTRISEGHALHANNEDILEVDVDGIYLWRGLVEYKYIHLKSATAELHSFCGMRLL